MDGSKPMKEYCITPDKTILDCLKAMDQAGKGILLGVDESFRLIGTVSDGDIRRALLKGNSLESPIGPHIKADCYSVLAGVTRNEVLDIMQARWLEHVPIVDESGRVQGLHLVHELISPVKRPDWAVIMAGGEGRRLRPFTEKIPKPMIKVAGRPILERLVLLLVSHGIERIFLAVNYMADVIESHFRDGADFGCDISYLREKDPLGSGGALSLLPEPPRHSTLLINGDLIVDVDLSQMLDFHTRHEFYATIGAYPYFHEVPYGCIHEQQGNLKSLEEKPVIQKTINAGIYVLSPAAIASVPKNTFFPITLLFEDALNQNLSCGVFNIEKDWIDVGRPQELSRANGRI